MYRLFLKRFMDFTLSLLTIIFFLPLFLILTPIVAIKMKGNPFFTQERPGKNEKIFKMIKYRSMTNAKDKDGNLLPDEQRLTKFGSILRSTSLDELPELFNILKGDMSIVGPRPLLVQYLPLYNEEQKKRHNVRPGLTGLAQVNGRNSITWEERFTYDVNYVFNITFIKDIKIIFLTLIKVLKRNDINEKNNSTMSDFKGDERL